LKAYYNIVFIEEKKAEKFSYIFFILLFSFVRFMFRSLVNAPIWKRTSMGIESMLSSQIAHLPSCPKPHPVRIWITDPVTVVDQQAFHDAQHLFQSLIQKQSDSSILPRVAMPYVPMQVTQALYEAIDRVEIEETLDDDGDTHYDYFINGKVDEMHWLGYHSCDSGLTSIVDEVIPTQAMDWLAFSLDLQNQPDLHQDRDNYPHLAFFGKTGVGDFPVTIYGKYHCDVCRFIMQLHIKT
jgi:hypothetical protein